MRLALVFLLAFLFVALCVVVVRHAELALPQRVTVALPPNGLPQPKKATPRKIGRPPHETSFPAPVNEPIDISGPLKGRRLTHIVIPPYPEWAEKEGVEGSVRVKIWVNPAGRVSSFMQMLQTSSAAKLDESVLDSVRQWTFVSIPNATGSQWGIVTFKFTLAAPFPVGFAAEASPRLNQPPRPPATWP